MDYTNSIGKYVRYWDEKIFIYNLHLISVYNSISSPGGHLNESMFHYNRAPFPSAKRSDLYIVLGKCHRYVQLNTVLS